MKNYIIPVQIIAIKKRGIILKLQDTSESCPRCKEGNGCGNFAWFQGLAKKKTFFLPSPNGKWQQGDLAQIVISPKVINVIAIFNYGLPLISFIFALFFNQPLSEGWQLLFAICSAILSIFLIQIFQRFFLPHFLSLQNRKDFVPQKVNFSK